MNVKIKTSILLVITIFIGIIIGAIAGSHYGERSVYDRMSRLRTQEGFIHRIERAINPTEDQKEIVTRLLAEHFDKIKNISTDARTLIKSQNDSILLALKPILTDEQIVKLEKRLKRKRGFSHKNKSEKKSEN